MYSIRAHDYYAKKTGEIKDAGLKAVLEAYRKEYGWFSQ